MAPSPRCDIIMLCILAHCGPEFVPNSAQNFDPRDPNLVLDRYPTVRKRDPIVNFFFTSHEFCISVCGVQYEALNSWQLNLQLLTMIKYKQRGPTVGKLVNNRSNQHETIYILIVQPFVGFDTIDVARSINVFLKTLSTIEYKQRQSTVTNLDSTLHHHA